MTDSQEKHTARKQIAQILKPAREARGLLMKQVIEGTGIKYSRYCDMERAESYLVTPEMIVALANRLGLDSKEMLALAKPLFPQPRKTRKRKPVTAWDKIVDAAGRKHGLMRARALWGRAEMKSFHMGTLRLDFQDEKLALAGAGHVDQIQAASKARRIVITCREKDILDTRTGSVRRKGDAGHLDALRQYGPPHGFSERSPQA